MSEWRQGTVVVAAPGKAISDKMNDDVPKMRHRDPDCRLTGRYLFIREVPVWASNAAAASSLSGRFLDKPVADGHVRATGDPGAHSA